MIALISCPSGSQLGGWSDPNFGTLGPTMLKLLSLSTPLLAAAALCLISAHFG